MNRTYGPSSSKWLFYNLLAITFCLPLPLGSNRAWAWSFMEAWIFALFAVWLLLVFKGNLRLTEYVKKCWLPIALIMLISLLTALQLTPWSLDFKPIGILNEMGWNQVSLDPGATVEHLLKTLSYLCLFVLTLALINKEKRLKTLLTVFFFSGLFEASYGSLMTMTGIEKIFFMDKEAYIGNATGTFVNRNNFANYLTMCIAAGTALLLIDLSNSKKQSIKEMLIGVLRFLMSPKMLLRLGLAVIVVGIVMSRSRMGNVSFFIALATAGFLWMILTHSITRNSLILLASLIIIDLWVVGNWFGFEKVQERLQNTSASTETRDEVVRDTLVYIDQHPMTGTGGGTFHSVYPFYKSPDVNGFYNHTHNDYLQILSEYGIIGLVIMALLVISSGFTALRAMRLRKNPTMQATAFTTIMVIIALLIHSLVDFNLPIMANAASATIILALGWLVRHLPTKH